MSPPDPLRRLRRRLRAGALGAASPRRRPGRPVCLSRIALAARPPARTGRARAVVGGRRRRSASVLRAAPRAWARLRPPRRRRLRPGAAVLAIAGVAPDVHRARPVRPLRRPGRWRGRPARHRPPAPSAGTLRCRRFACVPADRGGRWRRPVRHYRPSGRSAGAPRPGAPGRRRCRRQVRRLEDDHRRLEHRGRGRPGRGAGGPARAGPARGRRRLPGRGAGRRRRPDEPGAGGRWARTGAGDRGRDRARGGPRAGQLALGAGAGRRRGRRTDVPAGRRAGACRAGASGSGGPPGGLAGPPRPVPALTAPSSDPPDPSLSSLSFGSFSSIRAISRQAPGRADP